MQSSKTLQARSHTGMFGAETVLPDRQGALVQNPRFFVVPGSQEQIREMIQAHSHFTVTGTKSLPPDL